MKIHLAVPFIPSKGQHATAYLSPAALCHQKRPYPINPLHGLWTSNPERVTCPRCRRLLKERHDAEVAARISRVLHTGNPEAAA